MERPFRLCDIRGVYPEEVNEELLVRAGRGIAGRCAPGEEVLVARDHRASSPALHEALIEGLLSGGVNVADAGAVPTPVVYYGKRHLGLRYAATVTASHNPRTHNGLKILPPDQAEIAGEAQRLAQGPVRLGAARGELRTVDLFSPYLEAMELRWGRRLKLPAGSRLVLDPGGGLWCGYATRVFARLGVETAAIHDSPSSTFEGRSPDCASQGALRRLGEEVRRWGATAGLAWDGDGDRLAVCDEEGNPLSTDQAALLFLPPMLAATGPEAVVLDVKMSDRVHEAVRRAQSRVVTASSAHCLLERAMRVNDCWFGCEYSGHYFFRELDYADDGLFAALLFCALVLAGGRPLSRQVAALPRLFITPDIRIACDGDGFAGALERLRAEFPGGGYDQLDGLRILTPEGWILARKSVSEDKLTLRLEGRSQEGLDLLSARVAKAIPESRAYLSRP
jgi:phosphomannomutase